jgi:hypothetical protein
MRAELRSGLECYAVFSTCKRGILEPARFLAFREAVDECGTRDE